MTSRQILMTHDSIMYTRQKNLECKYIAYIYIQVKMNKNTHCHAPKSMMNCGKPLDGVTNRN